MRKFFFFISILILVFCLHADAQKDSTHKFLKQDSLAAKNKATFGTDTIPPATSRTTKVNNGKEILLDTLKPKKDSATKALAKKDSISIHKHIPRRATIRSAIIPGWGQAYNHEYWKIPLVYGAISIPTVTFIYNNNWYKRTRDAYNILVNGGDSTKIYPKLQGIPAENLIYYRNSFRKDRDYSVLFFLFAWGLNVVDATVFAHLKEFDVSRDLSMQINPDYDINTKTPSLGFVFNYKTPVKKMLPANF